MPLSLSEESAKQAASDRSWLFPAALLDRLQWAPAIPALALCLQGRSCTAAWLILSFLLPAVRFLLVPSFRQRTLDWLQKLAETLERYPVLSGQEPWPAVLVYVVLPMASFLLLRDYAIVSGDSRPAVLTASTLVSSGHCNLSQVAEFYAKHRLFTVDGETPYFFRRTDAGLYSSYPLGMVPFVLPTAAAARLLGADLSRPNVHDRLEKWTAAWLAGLSLGLFYLLALHLAPPWPAWLSTLILGTGSVMFTTVGQALWQHDGVIFWSLLALLIEFRNHDRPHLAATCVQGLTIGMMLACRLSSVAFIVPFIFWIFLRSPGRALTLAAFSGCSFAPWALFHASIYGTIFGPSTGQLADYNWSPLNLNSLAAILISPGRGILVYQPWILLTALLLFPFFRDKMSVIQRTSDPSGWMGCCVWVIVLHLGLISSWKCWWGGYCWGSRLAAEVIPLLALWCVRPIAVLWSTGIGKGLVLTLAMLSCLMHVPAIYLRSADWNRRVDVIHHTEKLWSWTDPPFLYPLLH
jgi:hypothetical protein